MLAVTVILSNRFQSLQPEPGRVGETNRPTSVPSSIRPLNAFEEGYAFLNSIPTGKAKLSMRRRSAPKNTLEKKLTRSPPLCIPDYAS